MSSYYIGFPYHRWIWIFKISAAVVTKLDIREILRLSHIWPSWILYILTLLLILLVIDGNLFSRSQVGARPLIYHQQHLLSEGEEKAKWELSPRPVCLYSNAQEFIPSKNEYQRWMNIQNWVNKIREMNTWSLL